MLSLAFLVFFLVDDRRGPLLVVVFLSFIHIVEEVITELARPKRMNSWSS